MKARCHADRWSGLEISLFEGGGGYDLNVKLIAEKNSSIEKVKMWEGKFM